MFSTGNFVVLFAIIGISLGNSNFLKNADTRISQCGGTIDADTDSLNYPDAGEALKAGEVCVWTIHLETTKNFKFNFTSLNVNSNDDDCRDGGIRIYSLTNLVPSDNLESYTFCDKKPSVDSFYLGENVAVVILYIGSGNSNPGSGFTLSWEGSAFDPLKTKHVSSFSTASNGVIRYPVVGHYEPNLAATWLIKSISMQETTTSDLSLESLELESCGNPDKCTCDALILFEISPLGFLNETQRLCGEISSGVVGGIQSRFIVAFFTDFNTEPSGGGGFEVVYYHSSEETTTVATETTTPGQVISTSCGGLLKGRVGYIRYKEDENYRANERCVWTIRIPDTSKILFSLGNDGISDPFDGVLVSSFRRESGKNRTVVENHVLSGDEDTVTLNGSVATVVFYSEESLQGYGFVLFFRADDLITPEYHLLSRDVSTSVTDQVQKFSNPQGEGNVRYLPLELSTFVFTPFNDTFNKETSSLISYEKRDLAETFCYDYLSVFSLRRTGMHAAAFEFVDQYCGDVQVRNATFDDVGVIIFSSDDSQEGAGFYLSCIQASI